MWTDDLDILYILDLDILTKQVPLHTKLDAPGQGIGNVQPEWE